MAAIAHKIESGFIPPPAHKSKGNTLPRDTPRIRARNNDEVTYEGKPCKHDDTTTKYVSNGICKVCSIRIKRERQERDKPIEKAWRARNATKLQQQHRKQKYKLTPEEYEVRLKEQNYCCAICKQPLDLGRRTHTDHKGNLVRGILCGHCNAGLGLFHDNPIYLQNAVQYVIKGCESWQQLPTR